MQRLNFPQHLYTVDGGNLAAYSPSAGKMTEFMPLPNINPATGAAHAAVEIVHSALHPAWLVFLRVLNSAGDPFPLPFFVMLLFQLCPTHAQLRSGPNDER